MPSTLMVLAVVLGLTPLPDASTHPLHVNYAAVQNTIGSYFESADQRGRIHLHGTDRRTEESFDVMIDEDGHVTAVVGDKVVLFKVTRLPA